ncbi:MAG: hypothetical protein H6719_29495 [Sandaracinaceae bacterium]|nr:hypothetical protein [Sandaracinaceae bacterium]
MAENLRTLTFEVPAPWTRLRVGHADVPGIEVKTEEHLRIYAKGEVHQSDVVGQATGQVWLQAIDDVVVMARRKLLVSSTGATYVTANRGITVLAGFKPAPILSENFPGTFPKGAEGYEKSADIVGGLATGLAIALGIGVAATKVTETAVGSHFSIWQSTGAAIDVVGAALNVAMLAWKKDVKLPGIQLWSQGGTVIGSTFGSVDILGLGGVTFGAPFVGTSGWFSTRLRGMKHVGVTSCNAVSIAGIMGVTARSVLSTRVAARTGELVCFAMKRFEIGVPNRPGRPYVPVATLGSLTLPNPQQLTQTVLFRALNEVTMTAATSIAFNPLFDFTTKAFHTKVEGAKVLLDGGWKVTVDQPGQSIGVAPPVPGATLSLKIDAAGVSIAGPTVGLSAGVDGIGIEAGTSSVTVVPGVSLAVDGLEVSLG